jgi:plasmid stabilization system protein ParE
MKVRYTKTALAEIDEIRSYIARDNPKAAAAIEKTINRIAERPQIGWDPSPRESGERGGVRGRFR